MPKNPVRAARQSGRQEVRAAKQTSKVAKIQSRTQTKVAKIQGRSGTPAAATTPAPKFKTAAELKSTIKMPDMAATINKVGREVSIKNATGYKAPAPAAKKAAPAKKSPPKAKTPTQYPAGHKLYNALPEDNGPYVISKEFDRQAKANKEKAKGAYVTLPQNRNKQQKLQVEWDKKRATNKMLASLMPNGKKKAMGGMVKGKKC